MKVLHSFSLLALAVLVGCSPPKPVATASPTQAVEPAPIEVRTHLASETLMPRYLRVTGQLKGSQEAMVAADAAGKVVAAPIERGSVVKAGDVLIKLDDRSAALALKEAEASVASSQLKLDWTNDELKRNEPLAANKAISDTDFQRLKNDRASAEAGLAAAVARRDSAKKMLDDASIRSPFAGIVSDRLINLGAGVVAGETILGANIFRDFMAGITDIIGGRSKAYEESLREARDSALSEMMQSAQQMGANAVIGVDIDYETVGPNGGMLMVSATGTAVVLRS